jgi:hypothetical protein
VNNKFWRSTAGLGSIGPKWNTPGTPVNYVIDPKGVIRYKWDGYPGVKAIDNAIETVIHELKKAAVNRNVNHEDLYRAIP